MTVKKVKDLKITGNDCAINNTDKKVIAHTIAIWNLMYSDTFLMYIHT